MQFSEVDDLEPDTEGKFVLCVLSLLVVLPLPPNMLLLITLCRHPLALTLIDNQFNLFL